MPLVDCRLEIVPPPVISPQAQNLSKKETESEGVGRLSTCNREAVQAVCEVLRLVLKETSCGRQQEAAASHSSKRTKECERAGGSKRAKACKRAGGVNAMTTSVFSASFKKTPLRKHKKKPLTPKKAPAGTLEAQEPPKYMPGASKWPLVHTLGHQGPQKGALWIAFGPQDDEFGPLWAPKVLKMDPFGIPLGNQIGILEPVGSTF